MTETIYLAGPMRGIAEFNFPLFDHVAELLRTERHTVFSPAERDKATGFDPSGCDGNEDFAALGFDLREALGVDLAFICAEATAVVVLPGWATSLGARAEVATAQALGLKVFRAWRDLTGTLHLVGLDHPLTGTGVPWPKDTYDQDRHNLEGWSE